MRNTRSKLLVCSLIAAGAIVVGAPTRAQAAAPTFGRQASFTGTNDALFGYAVAVDGDTAVVGAINDAANAGAAYVYVFDGASWSLQQKLSAPDGAANDQFGYAVALGGDRLLVGAGNKAGGQGFVYAFARSAGAWTLQQEFSESAGAAGDCFGCSLALSGTTAIIGADGASGNVGAAYVFTTAGTNWTQQAAFVGVDPGDYFGLSVGLSPAADTAVVGAFGAASETGDAYVFTRSGATWTQPQAPLTASDGRAGDRFGYAVAASSNGLLIGAYAAGGSGAAYVFSKSGSAFTQQQKLVSPDPAGNDAFGAAVALGGNTAVVGAYEHAGPVGPGATYVFPSAGSGFDPTPAELLAPSSGQSFGYAVAAGGPTVVVGGFEAANDSGAAHIFAAAAPAAQAPALGNAGVAGLMVLLLAAGSLAGRPRRGVSAS